MLDWKFLAVIMLVALVSIIYFWPVMRIWIMSNCGSTENEEETTLENEKEN